MEQEQINKVIESLDKVSEQGIRRVLYAIIKNYPDECQIVIDAIILKQMGVISEEETETEYDPSEEANRRTELTEGMER